MQVPSFALSPLLSWLECVLAFTLKFLSQLSMNALCFKIIFSEQKALASYGTQCIEFAISILNYQIPQQRVGIGCGNSV